ncbi:MAG: 2-C-methyl-D-erythritol 4-phosphate cytidylyltransferase [Candidatus Eisenbacteria bacterium]|nr:2-C-methyl-D-erythritol 4-phosphate cytidylyltransferase [Candidatus Eisenbacteria bacterium]
MPVDDSLTMQVAAIIVAAGRGERAGGRTDKVLQKLAGRTVLHYSLEPFLLEPRVTTIVLVVPAGRETEFEEAAFPDGPPADRRIHVVAGGPRRQDSVANGLAALRDAIDLVAIHDAARPLHRHEMLVRLLETAATVGAAVPAVPPSDTIAQVDETTGLLLGELKRSRLRAVQTPQVFRRDWLIEAHARATAEKTDATDDASLVQRAGHPVAFVNGEPDNIKLTLDSDFELAEALLATRQGQKR